MFFSCISSCAIVIWHGCLEMIQFSEVQHKEVVSFVTAEEHDLEHMWKERL